MQNRIKELREKRGISQADIARRVHLTRSAVGYYETGKRGVSNNKTWQKLADYLAEKYHKKKQSLLYLSKPAYHRNAPKNSQRLTLYKMED